MYIDVHPGLLFCGTLYAMVRKRKLLALMISAALVVVGVILISLWSFAHGMNINACAENLHEIAQAVLIYENDNNHRSPESLKPLLLAQYINERGLICPASNDTSATGPTTQAMAANINTGNHLSYIYVGAGLTDTAASASTVLAFEPLANHITGMNVVFGDGHVEFIDRKRGQFISATAGTKERPILLPP